MVRFMWNAVEILRCRLGVTLFTILVITGITSYGYSEVEKKSDQKSFASPAEARTALINAVKQDDTQELLAIFGAGGEEIVSSGDEVADKAELPNKLWVTFTVLPGGRIGGVELHDDLKLPDLRACLERFAGTVRFSVPCSCPTKTFKYPYMLRGKYREEGAAQRKAAIERIKQKPEELPEYDPESIR